MKNLSIIGRILFALPFGLMGLNHFLMQNVFLGMMSSFIPGAGFTIWLIGAMLIVACIGIISNKFVKTACFGLAGLLFLFIVTIHIPGLFTENWQLALVELLKDTGLLGGAIIIGVNSDSKKAVNIKNN